MYKTHRMSLPEIAKALDFKQSTIRSIVLNYDRKGRINKLLTLSAKKIILQKRAHRGSILSKNKPSH